ncbi:hypothetical protein [Phenylobacterium soli]|uniref:hypothetical protein n=1 Tax=Phenylobacterium soli TaxID=2170551 RepID=UPI0010582B31|nr:hypothetical protein [Phenylobacterium soli]
MANITVFEFSLSPNAAGEVTWPADVTTTTTTASTVSLAATTRAFIVTADQDCRAIINASGVSTAAGVSTLPILGSAPNQFLIAAGSGQTVKFA